MIKIKLAYESDTEVLALLSRITYVESHGHFIEDKDDLAKYLEQAFSIAKTRKNLKDANIFFYLIYADELPVGYAKLVLQTAHKNVPSKNNGQLEKIYVLHDFIPLKLGQKLINFVEEEAQKMGLDTLWLCTYIKNQRAIRFYQKNKFKNVGAFNFLVNETPYENIVFSKNILIQDENVE